MHVFHPLVNKLLQDKGKQMEKLSPEMQAVLEKIGTQLDDYEKQIKFLEHTSNVVEDEYENLYQQLKETNNRLNNFLEQGDIVYYISYKQKKSKNYFTSTWNQLFGFDPLREKDPISKRRSMVVPDMQGYFDRQLLFLEKTGSVSIKYQIEHPTTHEKYWLEEEIRKRHDALLKDEYIVGKIINVTTRELYEEAIQETEARFKIELEDDRKKLELIMNSSLDAIICMDLEGRISLWNPQAQKIFQWKEEEVMGKKMSQVIIPEKYRVLHEQGLKHYLTTGESKVLNKVIQIGGLRKDGEEVPLEMSIIHVKSERANFFCSYIRDITERKKAYDTLRPVSRSTGVCLKT